MSDKSSMQTDDVMGLARAGLRSSQAAALALAALSLGGCGASTTLAIDETIAVVMTGVFAAPADAVGNSDPKSMTFTLEDVTATKADGDVVDLYDAEAADFVIISREQIIADADVGDYVDTAFSSLTVTFSPTVLGTGKYEDAMETTLTSVDAVYSNPFAITSGKALTLDISVQWKNIVLRDDDAATETMSSPAFLVELGSGE